MQSRRTLAKMGLASFLTFNASGAATTLAQTSPDSVELTYQGMLAISNLPDLPTSPDGECTTVMQAVSTHSEAIAVIHNGLNETAFINSVSATGVNESGVTDESLPEISLYVPLELKPGEYGLAMVEFPEFFEEYTDVAFELDLVEEADFDPHLVAMPITDVQITGSESDQSLRMRAQNRSENTLAEDSGYIGVFFTPEGEIAYWFAALLISETDPGELRVMNHSSSGMDLNQSFMMGFCGRLLE